MFDEIKSWLKDDKTNNILALVSISLTIVPYRIPIFLGQNEYSGEFRFAIAQVLFTFSALLVISLRYTSNTLKELRSVKALEEYIEDECQIKQTAYHTSRQASRVVVKTLEQFFFCWKCIWFLWMLYYITDAFFWSPLMNKDNKVFMSAINGLLMLFDFCGSAAMLFLYVVLNDYTVDSKQRSNSQISAIHTTAIGLVVFFLVCLIPYINYISDPQQNIKSALYCRILLSSFGCMSFVMLLGKFNSHYLGVPKVLMIILYFYAVVQAFSFLAGDASTSDKDTLFSLLNSIFNKVLPAITLVGKIILLVTLSWLINKKRIIFFIVKRSMSLQEVGHQLTEFNRFMSIDDKN